VQRLRSRLAQLEGRPADSPSAGARVAADAPSPVDSGRLQAANQEIQRLEGKRDSLERRIAILRANVEDTPRTEQELATLTRDYQKLNENYVTLLSKQLEAQMAGRLEQRWKGDRFRMLDPPNLPEKPHSPSAPLILGLGAVLGLLVGLGAAVAAESLDPTVRDSRDLATVQPTPVLACIPHVPRLAPPSRP
jgi:uncharacterized protein involved in exopolysaccharide biosynthesis